MLSFKIVLGAAVDRTTPCHSFKLVLSRHELETRKRGFHISNSVMECYKPTSDGRLYNHLRMCWI